MDLSFNKDISMYFSFFEKCDDGIPKSVRNGKKTANEHYGRHFLLYNAADSITVHFNHFL